MPLYVAGLRPIVKKQNGDYILKWYDCEYRWFLLISCNVQQQKQSSDKQIFNIIWNGHMNYSFQI